MSDLQRQMDTQMYSCQTCKGRWTHKCTHVRLARADGHTDVLMSDLQRQMDTQMYSCQTCKGRWTHKCTHVRLAKADGYTDVLMSDGDQSQ